MSAQDDRPPQSSSHSIAQKRTPSPSRDPSVHASGPGQAASTQAPSMATNRPAISFRPEPSQHPSPRAAPSAAQGATPQLGPGIAPHSTGGAGAQPGAAAVAYRRPDLYRNAILNGIQDAVEQIRYGEELPSRTRSDVLTNQIPALRRDAEIEILKRSIFLIEDGRARIEKFTHEFNRSYNPVAGDLEIDTGLLYEEDIRSILLREPDPEERIRLFHERLQVLKSVPIRDRNKTSICQYIQVVDEELRMKTGNSRLQDIISSSGPTRRAHAGAAATNPSQRGMTKVAPAPQAPHEASGSLPAGASMAGAAGPTIVRPSAVRVRPPLPAGAFPAVGLGAGAAGPSAVAPSTVQHSAFQPTGALPAGAFPTVALGAGAAGPSAVAPSTVQHSAFQPTGALPAGASPADVWKANAAILMATRPYAMRPSTTQASGSLPAESSSRVSVSGAPDASAAGPSAARASSATVDAASLRAPGATVAEAGGAGTAQKAGRPTARRSKRKRMPPRAAPSSP